MRTLFLLGTCLLIAACTGRSSQASNDDETKPVITVTLEPQRYFTEAIAGDKFKVVSMVPKGSSPETYDPIPQQLVSLGDSKAYFRIGYIGFEQTWMDRLMNNTPHIQVFDTSKGIDLILNNDDHGHAHGHNSHADALKLEGGEEIIDTVKRIVCAGIPVMGHLGLMPQSINKYGTYTVRAKDEAEADKLIRDAHLLEEAGCFAIVLEKIPATLAERVASELTIPIIGIGAGGHVDGQVLVIQDMLGMNNGFRPRFLRRYADLYTVMTDAISRYVSDVKNCYFPNEKEQY